MTIRKGKGQIKPHIHHSYSTLWNLWLSFIIENAGSIFWQAMQWKKSPKRAVTLSYIMNKLNYTQHTNFNPMFGIQFCLTPIDLGYSGKNRKTN